MGSFSGSAGLLRDANDVHLQPVSLGSNERASWQKKRTELNRGRNGGRMLAQECMHQHERQESQGNPEQQREHMPHSKNQQGQHGHEDVLHRLGDREVVVNDIILREQYVQQYARNQGDCEQQSTSRMEHSEHS